MAKKKIEDNKKRKNNTKNSKKKINKSKIRGLILLVLIVSFLVYATYEIIKLVAVQINTFIIENGSFTTSLQQRIACAVPRGLTLVIGILIPAGTLSFF